MNQEVIFGCGSLSELSDVLQQREIGVVFLVTGKSSYKLCGAEEAMQTILEGKRVVKYSDFQINPHIEDVERGISRFRQDDFDAVIAVGGGTVLDMAKLINLLAHQPGRSVEYIRKEKKISCSGKPLIAVPTTAGSGSEATHFAVVYINMEKYSVAHENLLPDFAVIDPSLSGTMPQGITASTGMDALCQAVESYWSVYSTGESRLYAGRAVKLVMSNLKSAVLKPTGENRLKMAEAAHLAGKAINISKTTAAHALSYFFTTRFNVPHGHAAGLTLGRFFIFNFGVSERDAADERGADYTKGVIKELMELLGADSAGSARKKIEKLMRDIGLETDLEKIGLRSEDDIDRLINSINVERLANNPRVVNEDDIKRLLFG